MTENVLLSQPTSSFLGLLESWREFDDVLVVAVAAAAADEVLADEVSVGFVEDEDDDLLASFDSGLC